ncbi:MAG TPA: DUF192 domain-containing protein [Myxococcaceae bacterium]|nr:DUF192 domain-containing protein [Myxococcaceae bacterium]
MASVFQRAINVTQGHLLSERTALANTFSSRLRGLVGRRGLNPSEGLLLTPCNAIHTLFMRFPIDAAFLDADGKIVKLFPHLVPWRLTGVYGHVRSVLELQAGTLEMSNTEHGDQVRFVPV